MRSCPDPRRHSIGGDATAARLAALAAFAVFAAAVAAAAGADTRWGADYFPNVLLTTHEGRTVRFYDDLIKGKIVAIDLIYTTCQYACPLETARLAQVQRLIGERMGRDVFFYSITIDPDHDSPAVLAEYARQYRAGPGWLFLTGSKADIDLLSRKLGLYSPPDPANPDGHLPYLVVGNETTGQWMRNSAVDNPKFLARTIGDWLNGWRTAQQWALKSYAEAPQTPFDAGQYTFGYHCAACHTIGGGARIGPDLDGVTTRRDRDWLRRFIVSPDRMNAAGDPIAAALRTSYQQARMPNLDLSDEDASAVIDYLDEQSRVLHPAVAEVPAASGRFRRSADERARVIIDAYLRIQQALYADTIDSTGGQARTIAIEAAAIGVPADSMRRAATALAGSADLAGSRAAFGTLSDALVAFIRSSGIDPGDGVTLAFCPMARKSWLQKGSRIENPFYGTSMPDCGRLSGSP
jgi:protein SCO1